MKLKGITVGKYISKRLKGKIDESICVSCVNNKKKKKLCKVNRFYTN